MMSPRNEHYRPGVGQAMETHWYYIQTGFFPVVSSPSLVYIYVGLKTLLAL